MLGRLSVALRWHPNIDQQMMVMRNRSGTSTEQVISLCYQKDAPRMHSHQDSEQICNHGGEKTCDKRCRSPKLDKQECHLSSSTCSSTPEASTSLHMPQRHKAAEHPTSGDPHHGRGRRPRARQVNGCLQKARRLQDPRCPLRHEPPQLQPAGRQRLSKDLAHPTRNPRYEMTLLPVNLLSCEIVGLHCCRRERFGWKPNSRSNTKYKTWPSQLSGGIIDLEPVLQNVIPA